MSYATDLIAALTPVHRKLQTILELLRTGDIEAAFSALSFTQVAPAWTDKTVSLATAARLGFSDPAWEKFADDGAGSTGIYLPHFSASQSNEVYFDLQLPHGLRSENTIKLHLHWAPVTADVGNVFWELEYLKSSRTGSPGNSTVIQIAATTKGTAKMEQVTSLVHLSNLDDSDIVICRLARVGGDAADTYTGKAAGVSVDAHINLERFGSETEYPDAGE
jgi:hypothetical protein